MLTHIDSRNRPQMVNVGEKEVTLRTARAVSIVRFPPAVAQKLRAANYSLTKGPVFSTAIVAGVMAAKSTHQLIPFCHSLVLNDCSIDIDPKGDDVVIACQVAARARTGVEMEALTGASVAALTIYDMCKALSHDIEIVATRVTYKRGGKNDLGDDE